MADDILRRCTLCGVEKPESGFYRRANGSLRRDCKACRVRRCGEYVAKHANAISEYKKTWRVENLQRLKEAKRLRYLQESERIKKKAAEYSKANPERVRGYKAKWKQNNRHKTREYRFVRGNAQRQAIPSWANRAAMVAIYREARELSKTTGVEHHVDHIVPILSEFVCGLHCEANMQVLDAFSNQSKLNRWWPDMWE